MTGSTLTCIAVAGLLAAAIGLSLASAASPADSDDKYAVLVNSGNKWNGSDREIRQTVRKLFLKDAKKWHGGGLRAKPFDREDNDPAHVAFRDQILQMKESQLAQHWIELKQKTGETPPRAVRSEKSLFKMIAKYDGAFGIVKAGSVDPLPKDTRVLLTFSAPDK